MDDSGPRLRMTTREALAGMAMMGVMSNEILLDQTGVAAKATGESQMNTLALCAVGFADALLAELKKET